MPTDEELQAIKDRAAPRLMAIPSVTAVGIGGRRRRGEPTGELVLKVYVAAKRPAAEVEPAELVPVEFEGVPTDVVEMSPRGNLSALTPGVAETSPTARDEARYRPVRGGGQLQPDLPGVGWGTLGCVMTTPGDPSKVYALTNWHVLVVHGGAQPVVGTTQAGQPDNGDSITRCCSAIIGKVAGGAIDNLRDAGLVQLDPGIEWRAEIIDIGAVKGSHAITVAEAATGTYAIRMRGMRSWLSGGTVESINTSWPVGDGQLDDLVVLKPNPNPAVPAATVLYVGQSGDSGAAYVNDSNEVVGIHVSHDNPVSNLSNGAGVPIDAILTGFATHEHLTVQVATAADTGITQTVPGAAMVAVPHELATGAASALEPVRVPIAAGTLAEVPAAPALARLQHDLDRSEPGRALLTLWLRHQRELLDLLDRDRRVAVAWHRSGAAALFQRLTRMITDPDLTLPVTLHDRPLPAVLDRLCASIDRVASPPLRRDLEATRRVLPDLGGLGYDGIHSALGAT